MMPQASVRSADGTTIAYDRAGDGPPLLLVGGALSDRRAAIPLTGLLTPTFTVFRYDRRGRGDSGDAESYAVQREIEDLDALIREAGGSAFAFGHSSGAALALAAAAQRLPVSALALYEPPFIVDDSRTPLPEDHVAHLEELVAEGRRGDAVAYFMISGVGVPPEMVEQMRQAPMWPGMEALAHTIAYDVRVMGDQMSGEPLPSAWSSSVTIPTLVIDGGDSPAWARHAVQALADILPRGERRTLAGQDHGPAPEILAPALEAFFIG
jgi:pimeloyl-ACP methyl ester carboxylesterase